MEDGEEETDINHVKLETDNRRRRGNLRLDKGEVDCKIIMGRRKHK